MRYIIWLREATGKDRIDHQIEEVSHSYCKQWSFGQFPDLNQWSNRKCFHWRRTQASKTYNYGYTLMRKLEYAGHLKAFGSHFWTDSVISRIKTLWCWVKVNGDLMIDGVPAHTALSHSKMSMYSLCDYFSDFILRMDKLQLEKNTVNTFLAVIMSH